MEKINELESQKDEDSRVISPRRLPDKRNSSETKAMKLSIVTDVEEKQKKKRKNQPSAQQDVNTTVVGNGRKGITEVDVFVDTPIRSNVSGFFGPDDSATNESGYDHSSPEEQIVFSAEEDAASSVGTDSFHSGTSNDSERGVVTEIRSVSFGPSFESDGFHSDGSHDTLVKLKKEIARSPSKTLIGADGGRISNTLCLETGKLGQTRGHRALVRSQSRRHAQSSGTIRRRGLKKLRKRMINPFWDVDDEDDDEEIRPSMVSLHGRLSVRASFIKKDDDITIDRQANEPDVEAQYRLETFNPRGQDFSWYNFGIYEDTTVEGRNSGRLCGLRPNLIVIRYLNWAFRNTFMTVLLSLAVEFFVLTIVFALVMFIIGSLKPNCIHVNSKDFGGAGDAGFWEKFLDAYALSWTTFSTVGYGLVFPGTSQTAENVRQECVGITIIATLESFVGILFSSLCGAIVFAKMTRVASFAQVTFSDPMVIRYGAGLVSMDEEDSEDDKEETKGIGNADDSKDFKFVGSKLPCPLLEFRILNNLHGQHGGEIIDASVNVVASIDEDQAADSVKNNIKGTRRRGKRGKRKVGRKAASGRSPSSDMDDSCLLPTQKVKRAQLRFESLIRSSRNQRFVEDPTGKFIPRRIFTKLDMESFEHPFFRRLWLIRHVLDHNSPLLKQDAKELVKLNGGHWPVELNSAEAVRASICFDQILVSMSGTSNVDSNSVYAQHIYDFVDVCVGYRFCNALFRENDGSVGVDPNLLNDVRQQNGGGGEDLRRREEKRVEDVLIL